MIGQVPVFEAPDPTVVGTVKMFLTDPGAGVVPIRLRPAAEVGAVPIELVGSLDVGVVPATSQFVVRGEEQDMRDVTVVLDNSQILSLLDQTFFELVPPPGAGYTIWPIRVVASFNPSFGAYTFTGEALLRVRGTGDEQLLGGNLVEDGTEHLILSTVGDANTISLGSLLHGGADLKGTESLDGIGLEFGLTNQMTLITGGDPRNTLTVKAYYLVIPLP